jgi:tetratricopeptide (TPR) repeat protein
MTSEKLNQAIALIKSGNRQAAIPILREVLQSEPNNETAWLWLYSSVGNISQKKFCLEKALAINPSNQNARLALEKLIAQEVSNQQPEQFAPPQKNTSTKASPPQNRKPTPRPKYSLNKKNGLIGGIVLATFLCISIIASGSWILYESYFADNIENGAQPSNESPVPTEVVSNENSTSQPIVTTPTLSPEQRATAAIENIGKLLLTPTFPLPSFDVVALSMERKDGTFVTDGWENTTNDTTNGLDTLSFVLAGENYSDSYLHINLAYDGGNIKTAEGYEYDCTTKSEEYIYLPKTRWKIFVSCEVPELTTGHVLHLFYTLKMLNMVGTENSTYQEIPDAFALLTKEIVFEPKNSSNISIPQIDGNQGEYQPANAIIRHLGEPINYGDITITFNYISGKGAVNIKNNFIGSNTQVKIQGYIFFPNENHLYECSSVIDHVNCEVYLSINPAQEVSQEWLTTSSTGYGSPMLDDELHSKLQPGSCILFTYIKVENSSNLFENDKPEIICFQ